jgi:DNA repair photolyase
MEKIPSIKEIKCERALSPTGISSIAPYVINPYRGCSFGCRYCYSQKNKCFQKNKKNWGDFVEVKVNSPLVLREELKKIKPEKVLIGSTTEVYQRVEEKYLLTRRIVEILNEFKIPIILLTKSSLIVRDIDILYNAKICFTINLHTDHLIRIFEKDSPGIEERLNTIKKLKESKINTYVHAGPVLPGFTDPEKIMEMVYGQTERINFEGFNFWMSPDQVVERYFGGNDIFENEDKYNWHLENTKNLINETNKRYNYKINFFFQPYKTYWQSRDIMTQQSSSGKP